MAIVTEGPWQSELVIALCKLVSAVGRTMASQRCPGPNSQNVFLCYRAWQRGAEAAAWINANQLTLKWGGRGGQKSQCQSEAV